MTDKEKRAIERCNELIKDTHEKWIGLINQRAIQILLNLIEKQQQEIEDSIPKEAIRKLYNKYFEHIKKYDKENLKRDSYYYECIKICDVLKEILGE